MRYFKVLFIVILFFLCMIFFVQNTEILTANLDLQFHLFNWSWFSATVPIYVFILLFFVLGAIVSMLYFFMERIRLARELKQSRSRIQSLEKELNSLRNMPLEQEASRPVEQHTQESEE